MSRLTLYYKTAGGATTTRQECRPGCRLQLSQRLGGGSIGLLGAARNAAGWDHCLGCLRALLDGRVVRWEIIADPDLGSRVELTQTIPSRLADEVAIALAAWHTHLELFFAAAHGDVRCPWPQDRTEELTKRGPTSVRNTPPDYGRSRPSSDSIRPSSVHHRFRNRSADAARQRCPAKIAGVLRQRGTRPQPERRADTVQERDLVR